MSHLWSSFIIFLVSARSPKYTTTSSFDITPSDNLALWETPQAYKRQKSFLRLRETSCTMTDPCHFALVADLDTDSKFSLDPLIFKSYLMSGRVFTDPVTNHYTIIWNSRPEEITTRLNEGGRGLELSELILYKGRLLSFDDRTGVVFEYNSNGTVIPRHIITEGNGDSAKGMKIEWATEKDGKLWIGSFGKEYTDPTGSTITSEANFWIAILDEFGNIERKDWKPIYNAMRDKLKVPFPGYLLHEAIMWSPYLDKWVVLPRRVSKEMYDEIEDEKRGSNIVLLASKDFSEIQSLTAGKIYPERGFSCFKFLPGTRDRVVFAVKSVEDSKSNLQKSYVSIFSTLTGEMLLEEMEVPHAAKYEGIEFIPNEAKFPFLLSTV